jgi:NAD(P)-dependent dehydrogenase (short-subunit alcohol dehydrogenase family)
MKTLRILILGATSAMAEATARLYAAEGASIALAGRDPARLATIAADLSARGARSTPILARDLAEMDGIEAAFDGVIADLGGIDHVLLFYGVLGDQAQAESDLAAARKILDVDFTSAALWSLAAAKRLEAQGGGALVVVGSVAGDRGRQSNYVYGAAKAGLGVLVQGIAHRFALKRRKGLHAVLVKPGFVDTPMTDGLKKGGALWATPEQVGAIIRKAAAGGGPIVYAPWFWRFILLIIRLVPAPIFHKTRL